jgi:hypothetical protein
MRYRFLFPSHPQSPNVLLLHKSEIKVAVRQAVMGRTVTAVDIYERVKHTREGIADRVRVQYEGLDPRGAGAHAAGGQRDASFAAVGANTEVLDNASPGAMRNRSSVGILDGVFDMNLPDVRCGQ